MIKQSAINVHIAEETIAIHYYPKTCVSFDS